MTSVRTVFGYLNDKSLESISVAQNDLVKTTKQLNSGKYADNYVDLLDRTPIESYITTKQINESISQKVRGNQLLGSKLSEMERIVRAINEDVIPEALKLAFDAASPGNQGALDVPGLANNLLGKIQNLLESTFNNQKLFAGARVKNNNAIGDIVNVSNVVAGLGTTNYYLGDDFTFNEQLSSTYNLSYGIKASDVGFPNLIGGLHEIKAGNYVNGVALLNSAKQDIGNMVSNLGTNSAMIDDQIAQDQDTQIKLNEQISNIEDVDITEVMSKLLNNELQLKASFMLINRVSDLSLINYLK